MTIHRLSTSSKRVRVLTSRKTDAINGRRISKTVSRKALLEAEMAAKAKALEKVAKAPDVPTSSDDNGQVGNANEGDETRHTRKRGPESRTRRDRLDRQNEGFEIQITSLVNAFMLWQATLEGATLESAIPRPPSESCEGVYRIHVVDVFRSYSFEADLLETDANIPSALLRHGLMPSAPFHPAYSITIRALELYRTVQLCSPHLAIEPFVKALANIHGVAYHRPIRNTFSTCYNLYLRLREEVQKRGVQSPICDEKMRQK